MSTAVNTLDRLCNAYSAVVVRNLVIMHICHVSASGHRIERAVLGMLCSELYKTGLWKFVFLQIGRQKAAIQTFRRYINLCKDLSILKGTWTGTLL